MAEATNDSNLEWKIRPAASRPGKTMIAILVILVFSILISFAFANIGWGLFSALVLLLALNRYFFYSRFVLSPQNAQARYPLTVKTLNWKDVLHYYSDETSGYLATTAKISRFRQQQGIQLYFKSEYAAAISGYINDRIGVAG